MAAAENRSSRPDMAQLMRKYDRNKTGAIEIEELREVLKDMGLLQGRSPSEAQRFCTQQFTAADADRDNALKPAEFAAYYRKITAPKIVDSLAVSHPDELAALREVFRTFCAFGATRGRPTPDLGSAHLLKLCRDTGLLGKGGVSATDVDLAFIKAKTKGAQRLSFDEFIDALAILAGKRGCELPDLITIIIRADGPILNGTIVSADRFEDPAPLAQTAAADTSVTASPQRPSARPGSGQNPSRPSSALGTKPRATNDFATEEETDVTPASRRTTASSFASEERERFNIGAHRGGLPGSDTTEGDIPDETAHEHHHQGHGLGSPAAYVLDEELLATFCAFATFGAGSSPLPNDPSRLALDSAQFVKLCKESGVLDGRLTTGAVDLCFTKCKERGGRKLSFARFPAALALIAQEKGMEVEAVRRAVAGCAGPRRNSSLGDPSYVRLHDDKSTFTGVYGRGGPSTVDESKDLAKMLVKSRLGRRVSRGGAESPAFSS